MRRTSLAVLLALLVLVAGCGSGAQATLSPAEKVRAAADTTKTSSRIAMLVTTQTGGRDVPMTGEGMFDYVGSDVRGTMKITVADFTINERMIDGVLYLQPPGDTFFHSIAIKDLAGTSLSDTINPGSTAELLAAMGDDTKQVGTETIRGVKTTHYKGTITAAKAKQLAKGEFAKKSVQKLIDRGVTTIPTEAFLDDQGRLRRMIQDIATTVGGTTEGARSQIDLYDFGVTVAVQKPPASQVKDGADLLKAIRSMMG